MSRLFESFWLVIVTTDKGQQLAVIPVPDNRRMARHIAEVNRKIGHSVRVVQRHEWVSDTTPPQVPQKDEPR